MFLAIFVLVVYVTPLLLLALARSPVLIRGEHYAVAVLAVGGADALWAVVGGAVWTTPTVVFWLAHLAILPVVSRRWILWRMDRDSAATTLEDHMRMIRLAFEPAHDGFSLPAREGSDAISLSPLGASSTILVLGRRSGRPKVRLLRTLTAKSFRPVYPRPVITLRARPHVSG